MAITKTVRLDKAEVYEAYNSSAASSTNDGNATIIAYETIIVDDSSDDDLPLVQSRNRTIFRYVEDGGAATDISSENALVQTIAGAIWS